MSILTEQEEQDSVDLEKWVNLFDIALTSNDPIIKDQLRKLLMIVALADTKKTAADIVHGPFNSMRRDLAELRRDVRNLSQRMDTQQASMSSPSATWDLTWNTTASDQAKFLEKAHNFEKFLEKDRNLEVMDSLLRRNEEQSSSDPSVYKWPSSPADKIRILKSKGNS